MRRLAAVAAFLFLAASIQLQAQRGGGGHASAGGHGGFSGHASFGGGFAGNHSFGGVRAGSGFASRSFSPTSSFRGPLASRGFNSNRFNRSRAFDRSRDRFRLRSYGYGNCYGYGYGCGYGYAYPYLYGGVDPYWWWDSDSSGDQDQQYQTGLANEMNQQSLYEQQMRRQDDQDAYATYAPAHPHPAETTEPDPATVLVFRDQHKEEIKNYAIVGQTLWNFSPQRTQKIPLSTLDLPATEKANEDHGVDFHLPGANEGQ
ncbi:MAG: hypothetical protein WA594_12415 [Candidatus Sulfotelmatobacter sp.]